MGPICIGLMDGHPSERPTRGLSEPPAAARTPPCALLFGLAPARACLVSLPLANERASSLWRWSSPHGGRALPANLLYGARTFLERGLSTIAPAAVRPPPGTLIVSDSNTRSSCAPRKRPVGWIPAELVVRRPRHLSAVVHQPGWWYATSEDDCGPAAPVAEFGLARISPCRPTSRHLPPAWMVGDQRSALSARGPGRWPRWKADPPPCSARAARGRPCNRRTRPAAP
jgi:hypothetical protein